MKRQTVITQKKRGPPATGKGTLIGVRLQPDDLSAVDNWISKQDDAPTRPEAIRRLVELGLTVKVKRRSKSDKQNARASELAGKAIDRMQPDASHDDKASRKRRLLKGPSEFRDSRVDKPKRKS